MSKEIKRCQICGRIIKDEKEGCPYCKGTKGIEAEITKEHKEKIFRRDNKIADTYKTIAYVVAGAIILLGLLMSIANDSIWYTLILSIIGIIGAIPIYAIGEVIQILHDIRLKVWKKDE